ncbi:MAG: Asp-tRNA(Asn)/Glu-tRNA(Gln) amidotransferase subunit GatB [Bacilli bacterium]|nr:Asp-tRNA(Asn)/Glu-tRNA(Gln) amidotransferase subunit GatB [Bacilli bacterium]MDY6363033.1 Asp-tRNA(Asn)/Glu-tRNA(Gln) amidotransferase subunit GatB [Bacilli bacterium]
MNFEPVIGLEIHVELKTKSKMFSSAPVTYGKEANTQTAPLDLGFPGTLPVVNKQAVIDAIRVSNALHMSIDHELHFDRKNYFYSDLPKGYQITQDRRPIGSHGYLEIVVNGEKKRIGIQRLHMEEDTCKQLHFKNFTLLNYNRAGTPLIEIVSEPEIRSGEEAMKYVEMIRSIVVFSEVSDGKMEEGSLRCDVNVSIRPVGTKEFGTKVEVKNINSITYVKNAIDFEVKRQQEIIESGGKVIQETRRYDDETKTTIAMRLKTDSVDYKYFPEPNIIPIKLSDEFVNDAIASCPELAESKKERYLNEFKLNDYDASLLVSDKDISVYYDNCAKLTKQYKILANWINVDVLSYLNKNNCTINEFPLSPEQLVSLIAIIEKNEVSSNQAKSIFNKMVEEKCDAQKARQILGISSQISDESFIKNVINEVLDENPQSIKDYKEGKDRALGFMVGQVMKKTQGKVNPKMTSEMLLKELENR